VQGVAEASGCDVVVACGTGSLVDGKGSGAIGVPQLGPTRVGGGLVREEGGTEGEDVISKEGCSRVGRCVVEDNWG
jgi:hypothetical protein